MAFSSSTVSIGASTKKSDYDRLLDNTKALKDEAIALNGVKTFQSGTVFNATATFNNELTVTGTSTVVRFPSKRLTSTNYIIDAKTFAQAFAIFDPFIPANGDIMMLNGGADASGNLLIVSMIERTSSTAMDIYYVADAGGYIKLTIDYDSGTSWEWAVSW